MIHLRDAQLFFGNQPVFDHINSMFQKHDRIGLVGRNGSGKTTLLKAIVGLQKLDGGSITVTGGCRVAYLPQEVVMHSTCSIVEQVLRGHPEVGPLRIRQEQLEPSVESGDADAVNEYGEIIEKLSYHDVESIIVRVQDMLIGLGFKSEQFQDSVQTLSVGWQMRVVLANMLLADADFYLFDEPTNHLDIVAKDWFLEFMKQSSFGFLLVCHEKYFLNALCSEIFELEIGKGTLYTGNYDQYESEKGRYLESLEQAYLEQQRDIKKKEEWIARFKAKATLAKKAKSMERSIEKMDLIELPPQPKSVNFNFGAVQRAGKIVFKAEGLSYSFENKIIFRNGSFQIERGERIALVAPNGGGKTTLFNLITGKYKLQAGNYEHGYNVQIAVFEQEQHKVLNPNKTLLEEVFHNSTKKTEEQVRSFLGAFLFGKEEILKKTKVLSGGERNRLSMVKILLQDANFLLLDEPTNHLDIPSKEILLRALKQFDGTIFFVSHDHDFVNTLATRVLELRADGIYSYHGNYDSYLQQKQEALAYEKSKQKGEVSLKNNNQNGIFQARSNELDSALSKAHDYDIKKSMHKLERLISSLEQDLLKIQEKFADLEYGTTAFDAQQKKLEETQEKLKNANKDWESLFSSLSS